MMLYTCGDLRRWCLSLDFPPDDLNWNICSEKCMVSKPCSYEERNQTLKRKHRLYTEKLVVSDLELTNASQLFNAGKFLIKDTKGLPSMMK